MNSIRTKITLLTVCAIIVAMTVATTLGVVAIRNLGNSSAEQLLTLLCEAGEKNLDFYFESVEQSVEMVSAYIQSDLETLDTLEDGLLQEHIDRSSEIFGKTANRTSGVLTYYYRIDPSVSLTAKGFWYVDLDGSGFKAHEVTDITRYDTADTTRLVWFTVPKWEGHSIWLPPYITDNLDVRVISYNMPVYWNEQFIGVVGIEIDYTTMAEQVDSIRLYDNGYAFINDGKGSIIYHPLVDVASLSPEEPLKTPEGLLGKENHVRYTYNGVEKQAVWLPLSNGMRLNVSVPVEEIQEGWHKLILEHFGASLVLLLIFILLTLRLSRHITEPLLKLTRAAEQVNEGNYDFELDYQIDDEVGVLTQAFSRLTSYLKIYIGDLNDLAYADALTSVHNKGAFDIYVKGLQELVEAPGISPEFAVCIFDCNELKRINDTYGHDKGDIYLKTASAVICRVFSHSPVFRTGGDEFAVVLLESEYRNRSELLALFDRACEETRAGSALPWERADVARGIAEFEPDKDVSVTDVVHRADMRMYDQKRQSKKARNT